MALLRSNKRKLVSKLLRKMRRFLQESRGMKSFWILILGKFDHDFLRIDIFFRTFSF